MIAKGDMVIVIETNEAFDYYVGNAGIVEDIELIPSTSGGPVKMAFVAYDLDQGSGWVHLTSLQKQSTPAV